MIRKREDKHNYRPPVPCFRIRMIITLQLSNCRYRKLGGLLNKESLSLASTHTWTRAGNPTERIIDLHNCSGTSPSDSPASVRQPKNGEKTGAHFPVEIKILSVFINHKSFFPNVYFVIICSGYYPLVTPFLPARLGRMSRIKASGTGSFACITNSCQTSEKSQTLGKSQTCAAN